MTIPFPGNTDNIMSNEKSEKHLLFGLLIECPFLDCLEDCPIEKMRTEMSLEEKVEFIHNVSEDEIERLSSHHKRCLKKREGF